MLKKNALIVAKDAGNRVKITIKVSSRDGLMRDEVWTATRVLAKRIAAVVPDAPYLNLDIIDTHIDF